MTKIFIFLVTGALKVASFGALAQDSVIFCASAGSSRGGVDRNGYSVIFDKMLTAPKKMNKGAQVNISESGASVAAKGPTGQILIATSAASVLNAYVSTGTDLHTSDTVVESAPGVNKGRTINYTATMHFAAATSASSLDLRLAYSAVDAILDAVPGASIRK